MSAHGGHVAILDNLKQLKTIRGGDQGMFPPKRFKALAYSHGYSERSS